MAARSPARVVEPRKPCISDAINEGAKRPSAITIRAVGTIPGERDGCQPGGGAGASRGTRPSSLASKLEPGSGVGARRLGVKEVVHHHRIAAVARAILARISVG